MNTVAAIGAGGPAGADPALDRQRGAVLWWFNPPSEPLVRRLFTAVAAVWLGVGVVLWRQIRRPLPPYPGKEDAPGRGPGASN